MRNIQNRVQQMLSDKKRNSQFVALFIALSMIVAFIVPYLSIMPGIAASGSVELNGNINQGDYFYLYAYVDGNKIFDKDTPVGNYVANGENATVSFNMDFHLEGIGEGYFSGGGPHIIIPTSGLFGQNEKLFELSGGQSGDYKDNAYSEERFNKYGTFVGYEKAGTYQITNDGQIQITLTDDYISYLVDSGNATGEFEFSGTLGRGDGETGNRKITIGGQEIEVKFSDRYPNVTKEANINSDKGTVTWTITINNQYKLDMDGYHLQDAMISQAVGGNVAVYVNNDYSEKKSLDDYFSEKDGSYQIKPGVTANPIKLQYTTKIKPEDLKANKVENKAEFWKGTKPPEDNPNENPSYSSQKVERFFWENISVTKRGTPDYENNQPNNGKITWTIDIKNAHGVSLNDYILEDTYTIDGSDATVDLEKAQVSPSGSIVKENGKYVLKTQASSVTITYDTSVSDKLTTGADTYNKLKVWYPDGNEGSGEGGVHYRKEFEFLEKSKFGSYNADTGLITWTVTLVGKYGRTLKDYEITDAKFPDAKEDFTFTNGSASDITLTGNTIKVNSDITYLQFTYTTNAKSDDKVNFEVQSTQKVSNAISDKDNSTVTAVVEVSPRNSINKSLTDKKDDKNNNVGGDTHNAKTDKDTTDTLSWKVELNYDNGFKGYVYKDDLFASNGATHTLKQDSVVVTWRDSSWNTGTLDKSCYNVSIDANGDFTITFNDTINESYKYLTITYDTEAKVPANAGYGKYEFTNKGSTENGGGAGSGTIGYNINKSDPNEVRKQNLTVKKDWRGGVDNNNAPVEKVTVKLIYKTSENGEWKDVKINGNTYLFDGDDGYNEASVVTQDISSNTGWQVGLNDLPRQKDYADANGEFEKTVSYYYKVVETKIGDYDVDGKNYYQADNGFYKIENSGESDASNAYPWLYVKNEYYPNFDLNVNKNWAGDAGSGSGFNKISFQIQYRLDGGEWKPLKTQTYNGTDWIFDGTGNNRTFDVNENNGKYELIVSNLPVYIYQDGENKKVTYQVVETKINGTNVSGDRFITSDGYYEISNSSIIDGTQDSNSTKNAYITNTFHKTQDIPIKLKKNWSNQDKDTNFETLTGIIVELQQREVGSDTWNTVESQTLTSANDWEFTWAENNGKTPAHSIDSDNNIIRYEYRVVETGYIYNSTTYYLADNSNTFSTDKESGYYEISGSGDSRSSITSSSNEWDRNWNITNNYIPITKSQVNANKTWLEDGGKETQRPDKIFVKLMQRAGQDGEWGMYGDEIELNADNNWTVSVTDLPKSFVEETKTTEDGKDIYKYKIVDYYYQLIEVAYQYGNERKAISGSSFTTSVENFKYNVTNSQPQIISDDYNPGTLSVTNRLEEEIGIEKTAVDVNGNSDENLTIDMKTLDDNYRHTIGSEEYYVFNWRIDYVGQNGTVNNQKIYPIVDELPDGFSLCTDNTAASNPAVSIVNDLINEDNYIPNPYHLYPNNNFAVLVKEKTNWSEIFTSTSQEFYYYNPESDYGNVVAFSEPSVSNTIIIAYSTKIKVSDFKTLMGSKKRYSFKNKAKLYGGMNGQTPSETPGVSLGDDKFDEATITITNETPTNLITKKYDKTPINGTVKYTLDINPNGQDLSTGNSIDITDIFKVTKYVDHIDNREYTDPSGHLVDVLLSNIKIYSIAANGAETLLPDNSYTLQFDSSTATADGAALQKLEVPDETHLRIEYLYKIVANENTPSVLMGRNSSVKKNGMLQKMAPGMTPPNGDKVVFSNRASLKSDSADGSSEHNNQEYVFASSSGSIWTEKMPTVAKVNVADITKKLEASFLLAKYENGGWYYATAVNSTTSAITWSSNLQYNNMVESGALAEINVSDSSSFSLDLSTGVLYKLVEISVPNDYEGSNLGLDGDVFRELIVNYLNNNTTVYDGKDYKAFLEKFNAVSYFSYNSTVSNLPNGVSRTDVQNIKQNGELSVKNNELINIGVEKNWVQSPDDDNASVTVELWWSYTKDDTKIPADAKRADAAELGIMATDFSAIKEVPTGTTNNVWTQIPNGKDGKIIYYYVKETAYTVNGTKYTLNDADGTYKSENGQTLSYYPTYINNAVSSSGTVTLNNSKNLVVKKVWKDSQGNTIANQRIPFDQINVTIIGVRADDGTEDTLFDNVRLAKDSWTNDINTSNISLSDYKSFKVEESGGSPKLGDYVVSCVFKINNNTGEITITNKDTNLTEEAVSVKKEWSDGEDAHSEDSVEVQLYQATKKYTAADLAAMDSDQLALNLTAVPNIPKQTLDAENEWSHTWTGLAVKDSSGDKLYYYVRETGSNIQTNGDKYTATYDIDTSQNGLTKVTITNFRSSLMVEKQWLDADGNVIDDTSKFQPVTVDIVEKAEPVKIPSSMKIFAFGDSITAGDGNGGNGYYSYLKSELAKEEHGSFTIDTSFDGKKGHSGYAIYAMPSSDDYYKDGKVSNTESRSGLYDCMSELTGKKPDVLTLLIGTNDIISNYNYNIDGRLEKLVRAIFEDQKTNPDMVLFLGSIPDFDFKSSTSTMSYNWFGRYAASKAADGFTDTTDLYIEWNATPEQVNAFQTYLNDTVIANYNNKIKALVTKLKNEGFKIEFVDINSAVTSICSDGCHPDDKGNQQMAEKWAEAIDNYYHRDNSNKVVATVTLNNSNNWKATVDLPADADPNALYTIRETNLPAGWTAEYKDTGQKAGSSTVMKAVNRHNPEKISIQVEKKWVGDSDNDKRNDISLILQRTIKTDSSGNARDEPALWYWEDCDAVMPTPVKSGDTWTYTYSDLPAKDINGNDYYYRVEERRVPEGYSVTYDNGHTNGTQDGKLTVTNTYNVSLKVQKLWNDNSDHAKDVVRIKVTRSTTPDADKTKDLILDIQQAVSAVQNQTKSIFANKTIEIVSVSDSTVLIAEVVNGKELRITGLTQGEATIVVTDGKEEKTITVTVADILMVTPSNVTLVNGKNTELGTNRKPVTVEYIGNSNNIFDVTVDNSGETSKLVVTAKSVGSGSFMVKHEGDPDVTVNVNVVERLSITASPNPVTEGGMVTLSPSDGVTYSIVGDSNASISGNILYAPEAGTITVQAARQIAENVTDKTTIDITVEAFAVTNVKTDGCVIIGDSVTKLNTNAPDGIHDMTWSSSDTSKFTVDNNGNVTRIEGIAENSEAEITATFKDSKDNTHTLTQKIRYNEDQELKIYLNGNEVTGDTLNIKLNETITFTTNKDITQFSNSDGDNYFIKAQQNGSREFNVKCLREYDWSVTVKINNEKNVQFKFLAHEDLKITPSSVNLKVGDEFDISSFKSNKDNTTYAITTNDGVLEVNGNTIKALKVGTAVITASCPGEDPVDINVTVRDASSSGSSTETGTVDFSSSQSKEVSFTETKYVNAVIISPSVSDWRKIKMIFYDQNNSEVMAMEPYWWQTNGSVDTDYHTNNPSIGATFVNGQIIIPINKNAKKVVFEKADDNAIFDYEIEFGDGASVQTLSSESAALTLQKSGIGLRRSVAKANINEIEAVSNDINILTEVRIAGVEVEDYSKYNLKDHNLMYITLDSSNGFEKIIENLDAYDPNGNRYYYTIEEIHINNSDPSSAYDISYSFSDNNPDTSFSVDASQLDENSVMTVRNTKKESTSVTLPDTGGSGTAKIYFAGGLMMLLAAAGYVTFKRRRADLE